jgi:hypothetical protein
MGMHVVMWSFWAHPYSVSTVGIDEAEIRQYIKGQDKLQKEQIELDFGDFIRSQRASCFSVVVDYDLA